MKIIKLQILEVTQNLYLKKFSIIQKYSLCKCDNPDNRNDNNKAKSSETFLGHDHDMTFAITLGSPKEVSTYPIPG